MITKLDSGKWYLDIQPGGRGHKRYQRQFKTKSAALRFERRVKALVDENPAYTVPKKDLRKLSVLVDLWYQHVGVSLSSGSDTYHRLMSASYSMGNPVAYTLKPSQFTAYRTERLNFGIAATTMNRELQTFKTMFAELIRLKLWSLDNPFLTIRKIKTQKPKTVYLTGQQIKTLFRLLQMSKTDAYLVALVCLSTGARWGEAQNLMISDVFDLKVHFYETKSKDFRVVPVDRVLFNLLVDRLSSGCFVDSYSTFSRYLSLSGIGLPKGQRSHCLRHTFASHFMMAGGNIVVLQEILGHSSLDMTRRYAHLEPGYLQQAVELNPAKKFLG